MSDNIVGKDHLDYVKSQITTRQEILGKSTRDSEDIAWMNGKTSWVRLMSSVDIADEEVVRFDETQNKDIPVSNSGSEFRNQFLELDGYGGPQLSQENILQGGTLNYNEPKFGVSNVLSDSPSNLKNYGFGGGEFGLKPMPGITSFTSNTYNKGSLRKAQLQITAHNSKQFSYLESIYMRLGYTMLLEWGNNKFPIEDEDGTVRYSTESDIATLSLRDEFLYSFDLGSSYFYTRIEELRKQSQGNYDGFLGRVENFAWEFTKEGSYIITLDLISIGSVVESLKINTFIDSIEYIIPDNLTENVDGERPSSLEVAIDVLSNTIENKTENKKDGLFWETYTLEHTQILLSPTEEASLNITNSELNPNNLVISANANFGGEISGESDATGGYLPGSNHSYIRLGTLLTFINKKLLLYNRENSPLVEIDISEETYCYSNGWNFSGDPSKMINQLVKDITPTEKVEVFKDIEPFHTFLDSLERVGLVMNLYFEREYLKNTIKSNLDEENNLSLYEFLKSLLKTANNLLGGVNKLNLRIVEKSYTENSRTYVKEVIEIYDEVRFKKINTSPVFNIYGFNGSTGEGSFITDFNLKTEITKNIATQIAVGAQANGRAVGEDATLFSKWNVGLVDRVIPRKVDTNILSSNLSQNRVDFFKLRTTYINFLKLLLKVEPNRSFNEHPTNEGFFAKSRSYSSYTLPLVYLKSTSSRENFTRFQSIQKEFFNKALSYDAIAKNIPSPYIGFLPVNLSLTMDGLSGVRIFDKLTIDSRFLPSNYTDTLDFIITQLDHKLEGNKWVTSVGTLSMPKLFDKVPEIKVEDILSASSVPDLRDEENRIYPGSRDLDSYFYIKTDVYVSNREGNTNGSNLKGGRASIEEILKQLNPSPYVQNKFRTFFNNLLILKPKGYQFTINDTYRRLNTTTGVGLNSEHIWGFSIDMSIYEAAPTQGREEDDFSINKLYTLKPQTPANRDKWTNFGIYDAYDGANLRWGGIWTGSWPYDTVHFGAMKDGDWDSQSPKIKEALLREFPMLKPYIDKGGNKTEADKQLLSAFNFKDVVRVSEVGGELRFTIDRTKVKLSYTDNGSFASSYTPGGVTGAEFLKLED